jgi:hypothetical protein
MDHEGDQNKIRFFDLRDLRLVQRLQRSGQVLDYEGASVDGVFPLRDALHAYLSLSGTTCQTLVLTGKDAFVQYTSTPDARLVRLCLVAPALTRADYADLWVDLLEQAMVTVGAQGIHHVVAEAQDGSPEIEVLQRIGFGVFARQQLFRLPGPVSPSSESAPPAGLRTWRSTDEWGLRLLYTNTVPQLVQQIEAPIENAFASSRWLQRWVLERDGEILAGVSIRRGRAGNALRLLLHPQVDVHAEALIRHALAVLSQRSSRPIYCRVRRYESWLQASLEACGMESAACTALLVKHTVNRVLAPEWNRLPVVEGRVEMTSPLAHTQLQESKF